MQESITKKIGEIIAFNRVGADTISSARTLLSATLSEESLLDMEEKFRIHGEEALRIVTDAGSVDRALAKADNTETKLKQMRNAYIGSNWDNPIEIIEWNGFFFGALIVHWAFVRGSAESINNEQLMVISEEGINWAYEMIERFESELESKGQDVATE